LVTAKHNVDNATREHGNLIMRVNRTDGGTYDLNLPTDGWIVPDDDASDVAALPGGSSEGIDLLPVKSTMFATAEIVAEKNIGIGEELVVTGLFSQHHGSERNVPIVRSGIIAAMPNEPLIDQYRGTEYRAYLAELRSFGGLSGSPVFARLDPGRAYGTQVRSEYYLLGLVRGHWDYWSSGTQSLPNESHALNMGIGIVTPIDEVHSILFDPTQIKWRRDAERAIRRERSNQS